MGYIIKNTSGLINTRLTDVGRRKLSQGNLNILYFQIGDSEVDYKIAKNYNQINNNILMPAFNAQNDTGSPESNKENVKYPYYVSGNEGQTYGIPYQDSAIQPIYNSSGSKGFFSGDGTTWFVEIGTAYTVSSNYFIDMGTLVGQSAIDLIPDSCAPSTGTPAVGDFVTIYFDSLAECTTFDNSPVLTYKIQEVAGLSITLDRPVPDYTGIAVSGEFARVHIYPSGMTVLYDTITPAPFWDEDVINFETPCDVSAIENTPIWNMNIPWTENPAGLFSSTHEDYTYYGSLSYGGTKEYLGYTTNTGQTDTSSTYYYNSFDEKIIVEPKNQKAIAIIHYTNQSIDNVYGEKFATVPFDPQNPTDSTGLATHFKLSLPTLMWHKSTGDTIGQSFYIDPPNFSGYCEPYYIKSTKNLEMNDPGIRYFHLWDTNPDDNGKLNRIGKVFPDQEVIVIDDEEIVAALSYKSNRNWTLPAPKVSLITPNTCNTSSDIQGLMKYPYETIWVTYILTNNGFTNYLHCNYYQSLTGPDITCGLTSQDVAVRFGSEFPFLTQGSLQGFCAENLKIICQVTTGDTKPSSTLWREIDFTSQISGGGYLSEAALTGSTLIITESLYNSAPVYDLSDYISIPENGFPEILNFGDEYYFYGALETDISATIYEMRYLITLGRNQFTNTSNPTWTSGTTSYVTEIGLYDSDKDLIVVSKLQSPQLRQGIQQFVVKLDF